MRWELVGRTVVHEWLASETDPAVRLRVLEWLAGFEVGPAFARGVADPAQPDLFVAEVPGADITVVYLVLASLSPPVVAIRSIR